MLLSTPSLIRKGFITSNELNEDGTEKFIMSEIICMYTSLVKTVFMRKGLLPSVRVFVLEGE